jgi:hypothetical protein
LIPQVRLNEASGLIPVVRQNEPPAT